MVKHTQTIPWLLPTNCLSVFDHFVRLALKGSCSENMFPMLWSTRTLNPDLPAITYFAWFPHILLCNQTLAHFFPNATQVHYFPFISLNYVILFHLTHGYISMLNNIPTKLFRDCFRVKKEELTYFQPMFQFCTPWKHKKPWGFLMFSGDTEVKHWLKMG